MEVRGARKPRSYYNDLSCLCLSGWGFTAEFCQNIAEQLGISSSRSSLVQPVDLFESTSEDVLESVVRSAEQLSPYIMIGWSLGAMIALELLARGRIKPDYLVLLAPTLRFCRVSGQPNTVGVSRGELRTLRSGLSKNRRAFEGFVEMVFSPQSPPADDRRGDYSLEALCSSLSWLEQYSLDDFVGADSVKHELWSKTPTLILHGEQDGVIPVSASQRVQAVFADKSVVRQILSGQGHGFPITESELVGGRIKQWLSTLKDN